MARPAEASVLRAVPGTADLSEIRSRIRSGRTEGHFYVALLGLRGYEPLALYRHVRKGLAYSSFVRFQRNTSLSARTIAELIQIPTRTLTRRKAEGKLAPEESDRLVRAARIFGRAMELFEGDSDAARMWLTSAQPALGGLVPLELARTDVGASEVENLTGRLEYGIPS
ncbi:MAG TPA: antitoxin Xre/MbcA/ParS toxin-binding domain-containing protein [Gemmatimonadales bacterium]